MTNGENNKTFLSLVPDVVKNQIIKGIADHYGATQQEITEEVTDCDAEHLLDYVTGEQRLAVSVLMQKHNCR